MAFQVSVCSLPFWVVFWFNLNHINTAPDLLSFLTNVSKQILSNISISLVKGRHTCFSLKWPLTLCSVFFLFFKLCVYGQVPEELKYKGISVYFIKGTFSIISLKMIHPSYRIPTIKDRVVSLNIFQTPWMFPGKNTELNEGTKTYANIRSILSSVKSLDECDKCF